MFCKVNGFTQDIIVVLLHENKDVMESKIRSTAVSSSTQVVSTKSQEAGDPIMQPRALPTAVHARPRRPFEPPRPKLGDLVFLLQRCLRHVTCSLPLSLDLHNSFSCFDIFIH